ncbi:MAG: hypothetical protein ACREQE_04140, partial [Candidatus Binataceae bacterium]
MSAAAMPPDRACLLATLRDYVEQLREEGLEGLPASSIGSSAISRPDEARPMIQLTSGEVPGDAPIARRPVVSRAHPREVNNQSLRALV